VSQYFTPGIYVEEEQAGKRPIQAVGTSTAGFVGITPDKNAFAAESKAVYNWSQFKKVYCAGSENSTPLAQAVFGFFENGGSKCYVVNIGDKKKLAHGFEALESRDDVAIVAAPGCTSIADYSDILGHCQKMKDRFAIIDSPAEVKELSQLTKVGTVDDGGDPVSKKKGVRAPMSDRGFGAYYFPWIKVRDPLSPDDTVAVPPSGHLAGIYARTDALRGVHKAPANEAVRGALGLTHYVTREQQKELNKNSVNCIRFFQQEGIRVWGARTLSAATSEWRYINVRRLFNMIEESIAESTRWVVFEPNDFTLWKSIRRDVGAFLTGLWRSGALMGHTPEQAFFVKCDEETNPPDVIDRGEVVTVVGIAPVKPAEFIIFKIGQHSVEPEAEGGSDG
jgi:phage tail sheath protein FI